MPMTKSEMAERVFSRLAADLSTPAYTEIHVDNLYRWANEEVGKVITKLGTVHYQKLILYDISCTKVYTVFTPPANLFIPLSIKITNDKTKCDLLTDPAEFARWDSSNFVLTPTLKNPKAIIVANDIFVKPISGVDTCYLDYIKYHPEFSALAAPTSLSESADTMLVNYLVARCFAFLEEPELAAAALQENIEQTGGK